MEATQRARVRFLVRNDAWAAWEATTTTEAEADDQLDAALAEYGDLRLVAAYVLDAAADSRRTDSTQAAAPQVRRLKDGAEEIEYFAPVPTSGEASVAVWQRRAGTLREQVAADQRALSRASSVVMDVEAGF